MNNEPVAWMSNGKEFYVQKNYCPDFIPLYTHPVKELTDEGILIICFDTGITGWKLSDGNMDAEIMLDFARAILRKASEK